MIRFRIMGTVPIMDAATCQHAAFARFAGMGPWAANHVGSYTVMTRAIAMGRSDWGPWRTGLHGLEFSVPDPLPPFRLEDWQYGEDRRREGVMVPLRCGISVPVAPAYLEGAEILLDGTLGGPASEYGKLVQSLWDRTAGGGIGPTDPDVLRFIRLALATCLPLPPEAAHAWHLISSSDVQALFDAATSLPKPEADAPSSPCAPPASTP